METQTTHTQKLIDRAVRLDSLGFKKAAVELQVMSQRKKKLMLAYEHYRFVRSEKIVAFNESLRMKSRSDKSGWLTYQTLRFTPIQDYKNVPPDEVLAALETAINRKCFDSYEVAHIETVSDPLLFGRVEGCSDYFFLAEWDSDIRIGDLLKEDEG